MCYSLAARLGGVCAGAPPVTMRLLTRYGDAVGLAFQIADDVLDHRAGEKETCNYAALFGEEAAMRRMRQFVAQAEGAARRIGGGDVLADIARFAALRSY